MTTRPTGSPIAFGIHVGHLGGPLADLARLWTFADDAGFDWFSVSDHFQESPPRGGDGECYEAVSMLAAAACGTQRLRIGCLVFSVGYRPPGVLAKAVTTIDHLSGGRVACGVGAGWHETEYSAYGLSFPSIRVREDQLEEYVQALRLLFDQERADLDGVHYKLVNAPNNPKPIQQHLPIWIGGAGEKRTLRAAAQYADAWNAPYLTPAQWSTKNQVLDRWCEAFGRDGASILRTANVGFYMGTDPGSAREQELRWQRDWGRDPRQRTGFLRGTASEVVETVGAYVAAGVQQINIAVRESPYDWEALAAFAEDVTPLF